MTTDDALPSPDELSFADAMAELEAIVTELESDALDVDRLAEQVERAALLVDRCRARIDGARFSVEQILDRLDPESTRAAGRPDGPAAARGPVDDDLPDPTRTDR